jgi:magnesium chelatase family protein
MLIKTYASTVQGVEARMITVEVNAGGTVPAGSNMYWLVGLPDNAVKEGWRRMEAAIKNVGYKVPRVKLVGSAYDLPIALGIMASTGQMQDNEIDQYVIIGELSLDGWIRPIKEILAKNDSVTKRTSGLE